MTELETFQGESCNWISFPAILHMSVQATSCAETIMKYSSEQAQTVRNILYRCHRHTTTFFIYQCSSKTAVSLCMSSWAIKIAIDDKILSPSYAAVNSNLAVVHDCRQWDFSSLRVWILSATGNNAGKWPLLLISVCKEQFQWVVHTQTPWCWIVTKPLQDLGMTVVECP